MLLQNKRLIVILLIIAVLLLLPLTAMLFTQEVNWTAADFAVAAVLLLCAGLGVEGVLRKVKTTRYRLVIAGLILAILVLTWLELAVGIFGTPFAGR